MTVVNVDHNLFACGTRDSREVLEWVIGINDSAWGLTLLNTEDD